MAKKENNLLSKAAKGFQVGDVANSSIRNILTLLSFDNKIDQKGLEETEEYFDWKCPYTGKDLRERIKNRDNVVLDHIVPQNRESCGLNVKGNLVWVDKDANAAKTSKPVEEFLMNDKTVLGDLPKSEREARLKKIKDFQKECSYDPEAIAKKIKEKLKYIYEDTKERQQDLMMELKAILDNKKEKHRNTQKYTLNGCEYSKRKLALFIVEDYVKKNKNISYEQLMDKFENMILAFDNKPIIRLLSTVTQKEKECDRVYWNSQIKLGDNNVVVVNTQWQDVDMERFHRIAEKLGYDFK